MVRVINELTPNPDIFFQASPLDGVRERVPLLRRFKVQTQGPAIIDTVKRHHFNGRKCARKSKGEYKKSWLQNRQEIINTVESK